MSAPAPDPGVVKPAVVDRVVRCPKCDGSTDLTVIVKEMSIYFVRNPAKGEDRAPILGSQCLDDTAILQTICPCGCSFPWPADIDYDWA